MYKKLCFIFEKKSDQQKCNTLQEFFQYTYNKKQDMTFHISSLENLAFQLNCLGENINENMLISKILATLPEQYNNFITAWESTATSDKTKNNLISRLLAEGKRLTVTTVSTNTKNVAFKTNNKNFNKKLCKICKKNNHEEKNFFTRKKINLFALFARKIIMKRKTVSSERIRYLLWPQKNPLSSIQVVQAT